MLNQKMVEKAQSDWGNGILSIARTYREGGDFKQIFISMMNELYAFKTQKVLFKPTLASDVQFRGDFESALSYFIGGNEKFSEDVGFTIKPWTKVRFENEGFNFIGDSATAMGNYFFTDTEGAVTKVEYSFQYLLDSDGVLKIVLHHSSLPYSK